MAATTPIVNQFLDPLNPAAISEKLERFLTDAGDAHVLVDKDELVLFFDDVTAKCKQYGTCDALDFCINCVELDFLSKAVQYYGIHPIDLLGLTAGINDMNEVKSTLLELLEDEMPAKIDAVDIANILCAMLESFAITKFEHEQSIEMTAIILLMACATFRTKLHDGFTAAQA